LWEAAREAQPLLDAEVIAKVSLPPKWAVEFAAQLPPACRWFADAGAAWLWLGLPAAAAASAIAALRGRLAARGSCVIWRAPPGIKREAGILSPATAPLRALNARIKQSFDPDNVLNPGRLGAP
jgi:glycolate oxidase FAD binding subunit